LRYTVMAPAHVKAAFRECDAAGPHRGAALRLPCARCVVRVANSRASTPVSAEGKESSGNQENLHSTLIPCVVSHSSVVSKSAEVTRKWPASVLFCFRAGRLLALYLEFASICPIRYDTSVAGMRGCYVLRMRC
jgi:hypothetical protein